MKKAIYIMLLFIAVSFTCAQAQVAIGGTNDPHPAAILDLSALGPLKLGFLMPRAELKQYVTDFALNGGNTPSDRQKATGMMVYNMSTLHPAGVYIWDGDKWNALGALSPANTEASCKTMWDIDGNVYHAKVFGSQCWMTDNLRVTRSKTGKVLNNVYVNSPYGEGALNRTAAAKWDKNRVNFYPSSDASSAEYCVGVGVGADTIPYNLDFNAFANQFGFHYSWEDAKDACPDGWRLPKEADFNALVSYLGSADAGKRMKANNKWYYQFASERNPSDAEGLLIKPKGYQWGGYEPGNVNNSGFNAYPNGCIQNNGIIGDSFEYDTPKYGAVGEIVQAPLSAFSFGRYAYWWMQDRRNDKVLAAIGSGNETNFPVDKLSQHAVDFTDNTYLFGVRCIKE